jgi:phage terminase large subunit
VATATRHVNVFFPTKPHEKQREVLRAIDEGNRFILLRAGRKFRKTSLIISRLIEGALETGLTYPYIAPSKVQAKNIAWNDHIQRILGHFKEQGLPYKINEVELSVLFPNGGKVQLFGVENKEALRGISNWGGIGCDEYDDWSEDIWPLIIRPNLITHRAWAIVAGTPKGKRGMYRLSQTGNFTEFHFSSYDNPDLAPDELAELEAEYKTYGEDYYRQEIMAEYIKPMGVVYGEFNEEVQVRLVDYDSNLPLEVWWDFGVNDPTAMIWVQPYHEEVRIIDYYEASNVSISHFVQVLHAKPYGTPSKHVGDIAGRSRTLTTGTSAIEELDKLGVYVVSNPIPDITSQIRTAHKYVPRLFVSKRPGTERFIDVLNNYKYPDAKKETAINQSNEVPLHDQFSHGARAFEYGCWELDLHVSERFIPKRENRFDPITGRMLT